MKLEMWQAGLATLAVAVTASWLCTPLVIRLARLVGAVDHPEDRKVHLSPMPRIGGVAVFVGFMAGVLFAAWLSGFRVPKSPGIYWPGLAIAAIGMLLVGLVDDVRGLSFRWKLAAQIVAALFVWQCGFQITVISHPFGLGEIALGWVALPLTVLWIVGITNAVNLIDGLDGLAAGVALIVTSTMAIMAVLRDTPQFGVTVACVALAGSLFGFLRYNFNPAKIFLGDSGSMFLGFVLAVASIRGSQKGPAAVALMAPLLLLGLPILDTGLAILRRFFRLLRGADPGANHGLSRILRNGHHVFLPDREHIHHKLLDIGLSHRGSVLVLYGVTAVLCLDALAVSLFKNLTMALALLGIVAVLFTTYLILARGANRDRAASEAPRTDAEHQDSLAPATVDRR